MSRAVYEDDVIKLLDKGWKSGAYPVASNIHALPSALSERKKGKWVGADSQCGIGCPFCGTPVDDFCGSIDYIDLNYEPNFCPNCGADMRGAERREE